MTLPVVARRSLRATTFRFAALTYTPLHAKMFPHKVTVVSDKVSTTAVQFSLGLSQGTIVIIQDSRAELRPDIILRSIFDAL